MRISTRPSQFPSARDSIGPLRPLGRRFQQDSASLSWKRESNSTSYSSLKNHINRCLVAPKRRFSPSILNSTWYSMICLNYNYAGGVATVAMGIHRDHDSLFSRVLIPTDGTSASRCAVRGGVELAATHEADAVVYAASSSLT